MNYILRGKEIVKEDDILAWGRWFESADRTVKADEINGYRISTVFIGLDHRCFGEGPPIVFETMIFGLLDDDEYQDRYCTWEDAEKGHARAIEWLNSKYN